MTGVTPAWDSYGAGNNNSARADEVAGLWCHWPRRPKAENKVMLTDIEIAQKLWPTFRITGAGTVAVVKHCCEEVELCHEDVSARIIKAEQCNRYCNMNHEIRHRKQQKQPTIIPNRGYGKDAD